MGNALILLCTSHGIKPRTGEKGLDGKILSYGGISQDPGQELTVTATMVGDNGKWRAASLSASPLQGTQCSCFVILFCWPIPSAAFVISAPCNFRMHGILHMELALSSTVNLNSNSCHYQPSVDFYLNSGVIWFFFGHDWPWDKCPDLVQTHVREKERQERAECGTNPFSVEQASPNALLGKASNDMF